MQGLNIFVKTHVCYNFNLEIPRCSYYLATSCVVKISPKFCTYDTNLISAANLLNLG